MAGAAVALFFEDTGKFELGILGIRKPSRRASQSAGWVVSLPNDPDEYPLPDSSTYGKQWVLAAVVPAVADVYDPLLPAGYVSLAFDDNLLVKGMC